MSKDMKLIFEGWRSQTLLEDEPEPSRGRILVFQVSSFDSLALRLARRVFNTGYEAAS